MTTSTIELAIAKLNALGKVPSEIAQRAAPKFAELLDTQFAAGVDPNGDEWAPLKPATIAKGRRPPPLTDTGAMSSGAQVTTNGPTITMRVDEPADFHQMGTRDMAQRQILPADSLPAGYEAALREAADEATRA